mgnify:CR=1 FL=1
MIIHRSERAAVACPLSIFSRGDYPARRMTPEEIKALRQELGCTARELSAALGIEQETVLAWEKAELFPTKRLVGKMEELRKLGYVRPNEAIILRRAAAPQAAPG